MSVEQAEGSLASRVEAANRALYDRLAARYETVDGRRTEALRCYVQGQLRRVAEQAPGGVLLDLGCGAGFVSACAEGIFSRRVGVDISPGILEAGRANFEEYRPGTVDAIPYPADSFDAVACFAVLHHLYEDGPLVGEVHRVLRKGGIFYSDHDMELGFFQRFQGPLGLYRRFFRQEAYRQEGVEEAEYQLAEVRENGVDGVALSRLLAARGFRVNLSLHWYGLNPITDRLMGYRCFPMGWAPLLRVMAVKA